MKQLETITERRILGYAEEALFDRYAKEQEHNERFLLGFGRESEISVKRMAKYDEQLKEIHRRILVLEYNED